VLIHAALLALLFLSLSLSPTTLHAPPASPATPVQATVLDQAQVEREVERLKEREDEKQRRADEAQQRLAVAEKKRQQEEKRVAELEQKRRDEQQRAKALEEERKLEEVKLSKLKAEQEQRKREEEARRKKEEEEKRLTRKKEEEEARKKKEAEKKAAEEKKRKDDEAAKKQEAEQRQKEAAERARREQELRADMAREASERATQSALSQYVPMIRQKVQRHWTRPPGTTGVTSAQVRVRLTPTGEVLSAEVVGSSGNPIFDRSVENAVLKASPLPIPTEPGINERFRDIQFKFIPDER
jgi:colicin import membrane protein